MPLERMVGLSCPLSTLVAQEPSPGCTMLEPRQGEVPWPLTILLGHEIQEFTPLGVRADLVPGLPFPASVLRLPGLCRETTMPSSLPAKPAASQGGSLRVLRLVLHLQLRRRAKSSGRWDLVFPGGSLCVQIFGSPNFQPTLSHAWWRPPGSGFSIPHRALSI